MSNRVRPKLGNGVVAVPVAFFVGCGVTLAAFTPSGMCDRSEGLGCLGPADKRERFRSARVA